MLVGYARVSTIDQSVALQQDALKAAGCEKVFEEKTSSVATSRPSLDNALDYVRRGDTLVVWKLDRLGRSVRQLIQLIGELESRGVQFRSLTEGIDTTTAQGRLLLHIIAAFAQMERELIQERTRAGLLAARARGRLGGRKRKMTPDKLDSAVTLLAGGRPPKKVAGTLGVSVSTLYRWLPGAKAPASAPSST